MTWAPVAACVDIKRRAPHAIDARLTPFLLLLDGVELPRHRASTPSTRLFGSVQVQPNSLLDFRTGGNKEPQQRIQLRLQIKSHGREVRQAGSS